MTSEDINRRKGTRGYTPKPKVQPPGAVALRLGMALLIRKTTKPMPWANFVVWLTDPDKKKRSFHIGWNGSRLSASPEVEALEEREPVVYQSVLRFLEAKGARYVRETRRRKQRTGGYGRGKSLPGHDFDCGCSECQSYAEGGAW